MAFLTSIWHVMQLQWFTAEEHVHHAEGDKI